MNNDVCTRDCHYHAAQHNTNYVSVSIDTRNKAPHSFAVSPKLYKLNYCEYNTSMSTSHRVIKVAISELHWPKKIVSKFYIFQ